MELYCIERLDHAKFLVLVNDGFQTTLEEHRATTFTSPELAKFWIACAGLSYRVWSVKPWVEPPRLVA
jgi:hypothetical protein